MSAACSRSGGPRKAPPGPTVRLVVESARLARFLAGRGPAWYAATTADGRTRAEVLRALTVELARLGAAAGTGQPTGAHPPVLADHALADQVLVLAAELDTAPRAAEVAAAAAGAVRAARALL